MANIALLPGGFKPPHAGHYAVAKYLSQKSGAEVLVRVGAKKRDNITQDMSIKIWDIYGVNAEPASSDSPIADVFKYVEEKATEKDTIYVGTGEKDFPRFKVLTDPSFKPDNYKKYNPKGIKVIEIPIPPQAGGVSGTKMREFIMNDQKDIFQKYLPDHIDKDKIWNIVLDNIQEDLYNPEDKVNDYMRSSEYKAGYKKKNDIEPGYKYRRGGMYTGGGMGYGGMYEDAQFETGKVLHVYDFDDTIARVKANIKVYITSPNGEYSKELLIPAEKFPEESKELEARLGNLEIEYDFSEFEKQIGDAIVNSKVVNKLKDSLSRSDIKTTILTARSIGHPVTRYLREELGLSAYVVPLGMQVDGKVRGIDKANWIEKHIKKGYQTIYFIDDSEENRTAVLALKDKYPDIRLKVEDPATVREMMGTMNNQEKAKHAKNLKRLNKDLKKQGDQYMEVPNYLKGTLKRKMYERELSDKEERIAQSLPDKEFKKRYGKDWKSVKIATATKMAKKENYPPYKADQVQKVRYQASDTFTNSPKQAKKRGYLEGDTYEKMAAKGKKAGNLKQGTVRKRLRIKDGEKIPLAKITKAISSLKKRKSLSDKDKKYLKALNLAKTLKTTTNVKEGRKKKPDPKVGTGKKPKGSGRRLYTDENPSDTVKVKFSTRQDIVDTLSKASFKSKPHKRQSQIINLIHQRVRAALNKAKDPAVKKRLRSGFEYIKKRKEASKKKTQRMRKEGTFTKDWWKEVINEALLTEGGAAGHMAHPFNLPNVNNGKQLLDVFKKAADSLDKNPGAIKIDGVNASIRLVDLDGKKQFVMDRGSKKELDIKGITKDDLLSRFGDGHGMVKIGGEVLDLFNEALPSIKNDLEKLGAYSNPNILFNMEYVSGKTNVQDYGSNFIAIHGLNKIESKEVQGKRKMLTKRVSSEISYDKNALQSLLNNLAPVAKKKGYEVYGSVPTTMKKKPNFNAALSKNYTVNAGKSSDTKSLGQWLNELSDIPETDFIGMNVGYKTGSSTVNRKKVGAVSKQVYLAILNKENIDGLFEDAEDRKKAVQGFVTYLATEKLGDEVLKVLDSPMGSADKHEGVVIRDESIAKVPFKITGKFILGGMTSDF
jgi:hypothetical protein